MNFRDFQQAFSSVWTPYLRNVSAAVHQGTLVLKEGKLLFPSMVLFTETHDHYIAELFGASLEFSSLEARIHRERSTLRYLFQFDADAHSPLFSLGGRNTRLHTLTMSRNDGLAQAESRFGRFENWSTHLQATFGMGSVLGFQDGFRSTYLDNCLIVNSLSGVHRIKHVLRMDIVSKRFNVNDYVTDLKEHFSAPLRSTADLAGIHYAPDGVNAVAPALSQFASLFLMPGLHETTLGHFLKLNPDYVRAAFQCPSFLHEPTFDWIEGNPDLREKSIRPDLMPRRHDGGFDICDLKTAELKRRSLTTGGHKRRRFVEVVHDGLAQLGNYRAYFEHPKNREHARTRHGVEIREPNLILVVGSYENFPREEIEEASRILDKRISVIDYDTLNALARAGSASSTAP